MVRRRLSAGYRTTVDLGALVAGLVLLAALWQVPSGAAQSTAAQSGAAQNAETPEITSHDTQPDFALHVQRSEVVVRVVVRDASGKPVSNLQQADFRVLDNKKPQVITHFALEAQEAGAGPEVSTTSYAAATPASGEANGETVTAPKIVLPTRFLALYFDDIHLAFEDLARTRDAANQYLAAKLKPGDRAGIFTSSGAGQLDFTNDQDKLRSALAALRPRPLYPNHGTECPQILPYQAYKIVDQQDPIALTIAQTEAVLCYCPGHDLGTPASALGNASTSGIASGPAGGPAGCIEAAPDAIVHDADAVLQDSERESRYALQGLERVCRLMQTLHGQRSTVLISPGFMSITEMPDFERVVDAALRQNVVISTLDARGLYTQSGLGDASQNVVYPNDGGSLVGTKIQLTWTAKSMDADVLMGLADATGGVFFHSNNDFREAFERAGSFPEAYYVLTFAPQDLKPDGHFHALTVALANNPERFTVQARKGYFAPSKNEDATALVNEELENMAFSDNEIHTIPVEVHTRFFKSTNGQAKLSVLAHVDLSHFRFRKADGRNLDNLTVVTVLFDQSGNYVAGQEKNIEFRLQDSTLAKLAQNGVIARANLDVKPGIYAIREVVRESEGGQLSALNSQVEIR